MDAPRLPFVPDIPTRSHEPTSGLEALEQQGLLEVINDEQWRLVNDHVFNSSSMAADCVLGRSANGRTEWRTDDGTTLKQIQENA